MGYESRIYIVDKSDMKNDNGRKYAQIIARYDLSKIDGETLNEIDKAPETDCYIYTEEGETTADKYGNIMRELSLADAIRIFADATNKSDYRRYKPLLMLLLGFNPLQWENLVILHYGY